jgi:hypothetical protein
MRPNHATELAAPSLSINSQFRRRTSPVILKFHFDLAQGIVRLFDVLARVCHCFRHRMD